jgi:hypothetical protein
VLWLDAASGAVTHIDVAFKNTFGPGVHFTSWGEKVSETVDLHTQSQKIGPKDTDNPFEPQGSIPDDIFADVQKRRMMVSALSRDGIEVVPDISVTFKIDADPVRGDRPGSHFGYDEGAVRRAVINQAINPNAKPDTLEYKVAWNELPAALAADLWREYMSKFTLGQLFTPNLVLPAAVPQSQVPPPSPDADALRSPIAGQPQGFLAEALTGMIHELNGILGRLANYVERGEPKLPPIPPPVTASKPVDVGRKTALQLTNYMIKERLTNPFVPSLDANGQRLPGWQESREYWVLKNRGIRLLSVSVSNLRFQPRVEEQLASGWSSNWLMNAQAERERIETARSFAAFSGQEKALTDYAMEISSELLEKKKEKAELKAALRALLIRSRMILVRSDRMHRRAGMELQELEEVLHWLESDPT